jgi:hypothetical protein
MMASERISDWTKEELKAFILEVIEERLQQGISYKQKSDRPVAEVLESMRKNIWTPPPGTPSPVEILLDERERRSQLPDENKNQFTEPE